MSKAWVTIKGFAGLQVRDYGAGQKTWRQVYRDSDKRQKVDVFGLLSEVEAKTLALELAENRKKGFGAQVFSEIKKESLETEKADYIEKRIEEKRVIAQDNFEKKNVINCFFDDVYWPYRSLQGSERANKSILSTFNFWWRGTIGNIPITEIRYTDIDNVLKNMKAQGKTDRTIQHAYTTIQAVYNYARVYFSAHYSINLPEFCGKILKVKKPDNEKVCWLTVDEANLLLETLYVWPTKNGQRDVWAMSILALYSGLRFGDIVNLKWRDVEGDIAHAHATKSGRSYGVHLNIKPIQQMLTERKVFFPNRNPEDYIFLNAKGEKFKETPKLFEKVVAHLGFNNIPRRKGDKYEKITFHSLRHTFASWLAIEGVDLYIIRALMGHNDIKMTQRYAKLNPEHTNKHVVQISNYYQSTQVAIDI